MVRPHRRAFTVIEGGKAELERKKRLLFNQPWAFDHDEFDRLCELFKLSRAEAFDLALTRVKHKAKTNYEAAALLAVFSGSGNASDILAKGRQQANERPGVRGVAPSLFGKSLLGKGLSTRSRIRERACLITDQI